jgi:hypothetical protein
LPETRPSAVDLEFPLPQARGIPGRRTGRRFE